MTVGDRTKVRGYVTQDKYLIGRNLSEIERLLGFHFGRLDLGATFLKLDSLPARDGFGAAGYSMTAEHHFVSATNLDVKKIKAIAHSRWSLSGPDRLVKVWPAVGHDAEMAPDDQYPPGAGVPQWKLLTAVDATVVAEVATATGVYRPAL